MITQKMKHRVTIERNYGAENPHGHKEDGWRVLHVEIPCFAWESEDRKVYGTHIVEAGSPQMVIHKDVDVTMDDRIKCVINRRGVQLFGRMGIESVIKRLNHIQLRLKKIC